MNRDEFLNAVNNGEINFEGLNLDGWNLDGQFIPEINLNHPDFLILAIAGGEHTYSR